MQQMAQLCRASILLVVIGCGDGRAVAGTAGPTIRDSAGVTIVENVAPQWRSGEEWTLSADPLVIGSMNGPPEHQLFRVSAATRLPQGDLVIANRGTGELRFFDESGGHVRSVGRLGAGPGEFQGITAIEQHGDSLLVLDQGLRRVSVLDHEGNFTRSFPVPLPTPLSQPAGSFADGSLLVGGIDIGFERGALVEGRIRDPMRFFRLSREGEILDTAVVIEAGRERVTRPIEVPGGGTALQVVFATFSPAITVVARDRRVVVAHGGSYELAFYGADDSLERLVRRAFTPEAVTDEHVQRFYDVQRERAEARNEPFTLDQDDPPRASHFSAFGPVAIDRLGYVWVADYRRPWHDGPLAWSVFDPDGVWLGELRLPDELRILEIGDDYLVGLIRDEFEVEYVQVYGLDRKRG